jgi:hypothetical protein
MTTRTNRREALALLAGSLALADRTALAAS